MFDARNMFNNNFFYNQNMLAKRQTSSIKQYVREKSNKFMNMFKYFPTFRFLRQNLNFF